MPQNTNNKESSMTLIELMIASALLGVLTVGIFTLATYARFNILSIDRSVVAQNASSYIIEHISKTITGWERTAEQSAMLR